MDDVDNPYNPGAGTRPPALVGRDQQIEEMEVALKRVLKGRNGRSQILTGLRGVGKTVLLNEFEEVASGAGYLVEHIEVAEDGTLAPAIAAAFRRILLTLEGKRRFTERVRRGLGVLRAFALKLPDGTEFSIDVDPVFGPADSGDLEADLTGLFVEVGEIAQVHGTGVFLTIDELHYVDLPTLRALVVGNHRATQKTLPIVIAGAGLPSLATLTGEAKSYAERMFVFPVIGSLNPTDAADALTVATSDSGVAWEPAAVARVLDLSQCYPYFLQEFGQSAWRVADGPTRITLAEVEAAIPLAISELDSGFFRVRAGRTTDTERAYMRAMAELGPGPVRSGEVAALLGKKASSVAPVRDHLIKRSLCYAPRWGEICFTVPLFDEFMKRWIPDLP
jgi:hypothetical protein